mmetsp:Transcript_29079/g.43242  ORF Transcript_29079/g.43242 Transcript_29079/m.43242 type:complete len:85 (-) Transcript_29079:136-390(-)
MTKMGAQNTSKHAMTSARIIKHHVYTLHKERDFQGIFLASNVLVKVVNTTAALKTDNTGTKDMFKRHILNTISFLLEYPIHLQK